MSFKKKIFLFTVLLVLVLTFLSTAASSLLIWHQIQRQQSSQLTNALYAIQNRILSALPVVEDRYRSFVTDRTTQTFQELKPETKFSAEDMVGLLTFYPDVREYLLAFGRGQDITNYALYLPTDPMPDNTPVLSDDRHLYLQYVGAMNGIVVGENRLIKWDPRNFLMEEKVTHKSLFPETLTNLPQIALKRFNSSSGIEISYPLKNDGLLTIQREWDFTLANEEFNFGTVINIYDRNGQIIGSNETLLSVLEHLPLETEKEIRLENSRGEKFNTLVTPIKHRGSIIGYLSVSISKQLTLNNIKEAILLFSMMGIIVIVLALSVAIPMSRSFVKPVEQLMTECGAIARGDLSHNIDISRSDELGTLARSFATMRDSMEEKIAELSRLTTILETTSDLVCMTLPDHSIFYMNRAGRKLLGWPREGPLTSNSFFDIYPEHARPSMEQETLPTALRLGLWEGENVISKSDGTDIFVSQVVMSHRLSGGKSEYLSTIIRDISAQKRAEIDREKLESQLRQSQKMEAIGQLAGGIAHDFNNLLQAILGYSELAIELIPPDSRLHKNLGEVVKAGKRAKTLVSQMLSFSRQQVLELQDLNMREIIIDLLNMLQRIIGEHITLEVQHGKNLATVRADHGQMVQILTNLCVNARDAMPGGGKIIIETSNIHIDEAYCRIDPSAIPGHYVLLTVTDNGCGMEVETLDYIFQPFFTTKEQGKGTGLGLATVYGLVMQHKGLISVSSEVGEGTVFKIYLPIVEATVPSDRSRVEGQVSGGSETILVVEDDNTVLHLCRSVLEKAGYTVLTAIDGEEAMKVFNKHADSIDLVLLDVVMPNMGGNEVYNQIHQLRPEFKILFSSGYSRNTLYTDFVLTEEVELIQKPFQRADLLRKIRETLDRE